MKADKTFVLDADAHWSEPGDLFTSRAPAAWKDRVPRVEKVEVPNFIDGTPEMRDCWVCEGEILGQHSAAGVVDRDGNKENPHTAMFEWPFEMVHRGAYDPKASQQGLKAMEPSLLLALAYERAKPKEQTLLAKLWRGEVLPEDGAKGIVGLMERLGVENEARALLGRYKNQAIRALQGLTNATLKGVLHRIVGKIFHDVSKLQGASNDHPSGNA